MSGLREINYTLTHGERIKRVLEENDSLALTRNVDPTKQQRKHLALLISKNEEPFIYNGVNFSRLNVLPLLEHISSGVPLEIETFAPYLANYRKQGYTANIQNLTVEDEIGLQLAILLKSSFPTSRLISLFDDYNANLSNQLPITGSFSSEESDVFKKSLADLYRVNLPPTMNKEGVDYLLIAESSMTVPAEELVRRLEATGNIIREDGRITFINRHAENPLHQQITLRTSKGKWLCEALDAATFLREENLEIVHIVALPDYMRDQQDKVWEILRVLGIKPYSYHNIFYSCDVSPEIIMQTIKIKLTPYGKTND